MTHDDLKALLGEIVLADSDYAARYGMILRAMWIASELGMATGYRIDPAEPEWPVAFIELPTGQISYHMPQHSNAWDGHSTEEKFIRIALYYAVAP